MGTVAIALLVAGAVSITALVSAFLMERQIDAGSFRSSVTRVPARVHGWDTNGESVWRLTEGVLGDGMIVCSVNESLPNVRWNFIMVEVNGKCRNLIVDMPVLRLPSLTLIASQWRNGL